MLSKCSNPACSNSFLYLHEGKLFRVEVDANDYVSGITGHFRKSSKRLEFYWLCRNCAAQFSVTVVQGVGIRLEPIHEIKKLAS